MMLAKGMMILILIKLYRTFLSLHSRNQNIYVKVVIFFIFRYKTFSYSLGGSGLNTCRILANGIGEKDLKFFGAIGQDKNGKLVKDIVKKAGVDVWYENIFGKLYYK
jgi:sugar/nucleoside kinase (ribokinase family)